MESRDIVIRTFKAAIQALLTALAIVVLVEPAVADYIPPDLVDVHTERYHPEQTDFAVGTYNYSISWEGIPVARASVTVRPSGGNTAKPAVVQPSDAPVQPQEAAQSSSGVAKDAESSEPGAVKPIADTAPDPELLRVTAAVQTGRFIDLLYRLRHSSESLFDVRTLQPLTFFSHQTENSKTKLRKVEFGRDGMISARLWKLDKKGNEVPEESRQFHTDNAMFDPITAAFFARSLPVDAGESRDFDVFNGKHRFLITMKVGPKETIKVKGKKYVTYPVTPSVKKLTDTEGENRLTSATIWITADDRRDVVRLESSVIVGSVTADLEGFTPWKSPNTDVVRASLGAPAQPPRDGSAPSSGGAGAGSSDTDKGRSDTLERSKSAENAQSLKPHS